MPTKNCCILAKTNEEQTESRKMILKVIYVLKCVAVSVDNLKNDDITQQTEQGRQIKEYANSLKKR